MPVSDKRQSFRKYIVNNRVIRYLDDLAYRFFICLFWPLNWLLALLFRHRKGQGVLHISAVSHQPYLITRHLRAQGFHADYLIKGSGWLTYDKGAWDFKMLLLLPGPLRFLYEFLWAWWLYPKYEIVHSHFLTLIGGGFWEIRFLRLMGKRLVFHFRGCDIRDREENMRLNPELNACQECTYPASWCHNPWKDRLRGLAREFGDLFLVTTPDLRDFVPEAIHFPFLIPELSDGTMPGADSSRQRKRNERFKIIHVTNHEGIDGTRYVVEATRRLQEEGYDVELIMPRRMPFQEVLKLYPHSDLSVGKLRMGYYANAQIEALCFGVPVMCYMRQSFLAGLPDCPIINVTPQTLYKNLKYSLEHREELEEVGGRGPDFARRHHDGAMLARRLIELYHSLVPRSESEEARALGRN